MNVPMKNSQPKEPLGTTMMTTAPATPTQDSNEEATCTEEGCGDPHVISTYCGSFCNDHLLEHCEDCGLCASEFG